MSTRSFRTVNGLGVTAVTAAEMRAVDRVAVETVGLELLQMMENAGRILAWHVRDIWEGSGTVIVVAGNGGNGGGGLACARHLANRGVPVEILLDRPSSKLSGAAAHQYSLLETMSIPMTAMERLSEASVVVDAIVGYGLRGVVRSPAKEYIDMINRHSASIVSLDVPSGRDATTAEILGTAVVSDRTVTLALPKTGLDGVSGEVFLADIAVPKTVYDRLDIEYVTPSEDHDWVELQL